MNRDQKAAVVDEVAAQIADADAVLAIDYRGLSVTQAVELRTRLGEADANFRVVKNRLTSRAADKAGADSLKEVLEGPTAFAFVKGDAALAAKALANFRREHQLLAFKGGTMDGEPITVEQIESIARLPGRDALRGQLVGVLASPLTGLVRGLGSMVQGLAIALGQIEERGLVGADAGEGGDQAEPGEQASGAEQTDEVEAAEEESRAAAAEEEAGEESSAEVEASDEQQTDASDEAESEEG
jgi:large subunit ribosomal protein L10